MHRTDKEIDSILKEVGDLWKTVPHLRLGQLIGELALYQSDESLLDSIHRVVESTIKHESDHTKKNY